MRGLTAYSSSFVCALVVSVFLLSCGKKDEPKKEPAEQQNHGAPGLIGPNDVYCPSGYSYDSAYHQCYNELGVLGPFTDVMVDKCLSFGGGSACDGLHWEREFAKNIRGQDLCPPGTTWENDLSVCSASGHVYGPFLKTQHDLCIKSNGGQPCETMRWSRSFFDAMRNGTDTSGGGLPGGGSQFEFREPYSQEILESRRAWATYYKIPTFRDVGTSGVPLLDMAGRSLGVALHEEDWCHASLEGSVRVLTSDGRATVFNYVGSHAELKQVDCLPWISLPGLGYSRFYRAKGPFGDGVAGYVLQPFRTVAVDPAWVSYGTLLYIPAARGARVVLADGSEQIHDGYFFAADTGGALHWNHMDVFIGSAQKNPFKFVGSNKSATFEVSIVNNPRIKSKLLEIHSVRSK